MTAITVPTRDEVSDANKAIFDALKGKLGFVPNLYATFAHSENALGAYLALQSAKSSLSPKAREVVNLAVSEVNACAYCLAAHTAIGKLNGFTDAQVLDLRAGRAPWDGKLDALARFARTVTEARGHIGAAAVEAFLAAGWTRENLVDAVLLIGDKTVTNYLHAVTEVPVDFPAAPPLAAA
jgi:uncharacterized peroxidase-related enzyme